MNEGKNLNFLRLRLLPRQAHVLTIRELECKMDQLLVKLDRLNVTQNYCCDKKVTIIPVYILSKDAKNFPTT